VDDSFDRDPIWFRVFLKAAYVLCWGVVGFFVGIFISENGNFEPVDKNSGIQVVISTIFFALFGVVVPWHAVRRFAGFVKENEDSIPAAVRILILVLGVAMMFVYKWMLNRISGFWSVHF